MPKDYDFAGWVTRSNIECDDGRTIMANAFTGSPETVPLKWQHDIDNPQNTLGSMTLVHSAEGVYGYAHLNGSDNATHVREVVKNGDINALSIRAGHLKELGGRVIQGIIKEVSLVDRGANPGAYIDDIVIHGEDASEALIYTGLQDLIHSADALPSEPNKEEETKVAEKTLGEIVESMDEEQQAAVEALIGLALDSVLEDEEENEEENEDGDGVDMKHNSFENNGGDYVAGGTEQFEEIMHAAIDSGASFKHAAKEYGISNIEVLFPEHQLTKGLQIIEDKNTNVTKILGSISKSPFSFVKMLFADLDEDYMRAKGYITATQKLDDVFDVFTRKVSPTTIYKRQKLDRDDIVDIVDVNVPMLVQGTMKRALEKEIVRAVLVGDGRVKSDKNKISESCIIPIAKDDAIYTTKYQLNSVDEIMESVMYMLTEYKGDGTPSFYCNPTLSVALKLQKTATGKYLFGDIPTLETMASKMGVAEIVPTSLLDKLEFIIVNLSDYTLGAVNGGQITNFDDFDIDFNQYKYLIETRLSGALTAPKSAFYVKLKEVAVKKPTVLTLDTTEDTTPPVKPPVEEGK